MNDQQYFLTTSLSHHLKAARRELADFSFSLKASTRQWTDVLDDVQKEHEKEIRKLKNRNAELLSCLVSPPRE